MANDQQKDVGKYHGYCFSRRCLMSFQAVKRQSSVFLTLVLKVDVETGVFWNADGLSNV